MMAKPMKTLELHYPMIQFLIMAIVLLLNKQKEEVGMWREYDVGM